MGELRTRISVCYQTAVEPYFAWPSHSKNFGLRSQAEK